MPRVGIRSHDHSVRASDDSSYLTRRAHSDRHTYVSQSSNSLKYETVYIYIYVCVCVCVC
jgi:hypothetical protein